MWATVDLSVPVTRTKTDIATAKSPREPKFAVRAMATETDRFPRLEIPLARSAYFTRLDAAIRRVPRTMYRKPASQCLLIWVHCPSMRKPDRERFLTHALTPTRA